jgi:hypothetical protein
MDLKKLLLPFIILFSMATLVNGQNYIGLHKSEIENLLKASMPDFKQDKYAVNHSFNYVKYVDKITEQTILFFLSDSDICTYVRWMSDYANLNDMIGMLNRKYVKTGSNTWSYTDKGEEYTVKLEEEEWYFTVSYRKN